MLEKIVYPTFDYGHVDEKTLQLRKGFWIQLIHLDDFLLPTFIITSTADQGDHFEVTVREPVKIEKFLIFNWL
jgi:hypothetical protein